MPKLLWVLLPLLLAGAWLGVAHWRGRLPARPQLNAALSLLLLAYVLGTAGLGIFWVANQQLPVFDWHYLFGYATLLLVVVHLIFNLRAAWRALARRPVAAARPSEARGRRPWLLALGVAATAGAAFWLGRRHERDLLEADGADALVRRAPDAAADGLPEVERYHAMSSHSRSGVLRRAPGVDWGDAPPPHKPPIAGAERVALAPPQSRPTGRNGAALGVLLWHGAGISERRGGLALRSSPSSGALFSTELYVLARRVPGLGPGLWHHDAAAHELQRLGAASALPDALPEAPALIVATAVFGRTGHKYRERAMRYVLADLGHVLENLRVAARALDWRPQLVGRFDEGALNARLGLVAREEAVLALLALHEPVTAVPAAPPAAAATDPLQTIARRRSVRRFDARPLAQADLFAVLQALELHEPGLLSDAVRADVVTHAVAGLAPGAWRWQPGPGTLLARGPRRQLRAAARAAALDQDVIGEAAAVVVLSIDRAALARHPGGPWLGYRHAFLEAGLVGERVYLAAEQRGLGACAVGAFYDDEAAALVGVDTVREWVVHFAALGPRA
jgi:SagB-type dehydrogenase family enzyme